MLYCVSFILSVLNLMGRISAVQCPCAKVAYLVSYCRMSGVILEQNDSVQHIQHSCEKAARARKKLLSKLNAIILVLSMVYSLSNPFLLKVSHFTKYAQVIIAP